MIGDQCIRDPKMNASEIFQTCRKIIEAGMWLLNNGWGDLQIRPYIAPSGFHWRCEFHPPGKPSQAFFRYSSSSGYRYLADHCGGSVRRNISAKQLAEAIMISVPQNAKLRCAGCCPFEKLLWQLEIHGHFERKLVPAAFHEFTCDYSQWDLYDFMGNVQGRMRPLQGYVAPGQEELWQETDFWRTPLELMTQLEKNRATNMLVAISDENAIAIVAAELARTLKEVNEQQATSVFKAAIAALAPAE